MQVSSIFYYPVKSLAGTSLTEATIDDFGVQGDRRWMIVDEQGCFITQRQFPSLCFIAAELSSEGEISLIFPTGERFHACADVDVDLEVSVWSDTCLAKVSTNGALDARLSEYIGKSVRLVYMHDNEFRQVDRSYFAGKQRVGFADGFPLLLLTDASMKDLNGRLQEAIGVERFRPNVVLQGVSKPFEEDGWRKIRVGEVEFAVVKSCSRCVMTTVDSRTGIKGKEPLSTLSQYRKQPEGIMFGQNIVQLNLGKIKVGDRVDVIE